MQAFYILLMFVTTLLPTVQATFTHVKIHHCIACVQRLVNVSCWKDQGHRWYCHMLCDSTM